jgi:hypothetical protein
MPPSAASASAYSGRYASWALSRASSPPPLGDQVGELEDRSGWSQRRDGQCPPSDELDHDGTLAMNTIALTSTDPHAGDSAQRHSQARARAAFARCVEDEPVLVDRCAAPSLDAVAFTPGNGVVDALASRRATERAARRAVARRGRAVCVHRTKVAARRLRSRRPEAARRCGFPPICWVAAVGQASGRALAPGRGRPKAVLRLDGARARVSSRANTRPVGRPGSRGALGGKPQARRVFSRSPCRRPAAKIGG